VSQLKRSAEGGSSSESNKKARSDEGETLKTVSDFRPIASGIAVAAHDFSRALRRTSSKVTCDRAPNENPELKFLIIGAQKSGTTWLHTHLSSDNSPLTLPSKTKEVHFFDWNRSRGMHWYGNQFNTNGSNHKVDHGLYGEVTPDYITLDEECVREISTLFPKLRIIFVARDLVPRTYAAIWMELKQKLSGLDAGDFLSKNNSSWEINELADPIKYDDNYWMERAKFSTHVVRSDYATGVRRWLRYFKKDQVLILPFRSIIEDPANVIKLVTKHVVEGSTCGVGDTIAEKRWKQRVIAAMGRYVGGLDEKKLKVRINESVPQSKNNDLFKTDATEVNNLEPKNKMTVSSKEMNNYAIRPSLILKFQEFLRQYESDFNALLKDLGYNWKLHSC